MCYHDAVDYISLTQKYDFLKIIFMPITLTYYTIEIELKEKLTGKQKELQK